MPLAPHYGPMLPAIGVQYAGCRFRSRTEARWAVAMDALGWRWEYEDYCLALPDGGAYLPDFYLRDFGMWLEVKGHMMPEDEHKIVSLAKADPERAILVVGSIPHPRSSETYMTLLAGKYDAAIRAAWWRRKAGAWTLRKLSEPRPLPATPREYVDGSLWVPSETDTRSIAHPEILKAFVAARSKRFEFDEAERY